MLNEQNTVFAQRGPLYVINLSPDPPESWTQTVSRSLPNFLQGTPGDSPKDRPTDHATRSFTVGGIYLRRDPDPNKKALLCHHVKHMDWRLLFRLSSCAAMIDYFYTTILSALDYYLPIIRIAKCSTDKPCVTTSFRDLVKSRQRAFLSGDVTRYHRLRNRTQRMA